MSEWKTIKLGELYDFKNGVNFNKNQKGDKGILTIDVLNMYSDNHYVDLDNLYRVDKNFSDSYFLKKGDILFVRSSVKREGVGWVSLFLGASEPVVFCGFIIRARPIKSKMVDSDFLIYLLRSRKYREIIINRSKQSTITNISQDNLFDITIDLPPIEEQKRIVEILDKAFEGIAQAEANTRRNLINARELFDSYLNKIFTEKSGNWKVATIQDHIKFIDYRGRTPSKTSKGMRLITAKNIKKGFLQSEPQEFVDPEIYDSWMIRGIPKKGDILFTTEAPLGNVAQLDTDKKVVFAQRVIIMQPDENYINCTFLKYLLLAQPIQQRIHKQATGATAQGIKASLLKKIVIEFPEDINCQKELILKIEKIEQQAKKLETIYQRKLEAIAELKQSILEKAFTGQLSQ
ncbi:restriction endonuclease subunit S [Microcystis wesenbergii]|uniref:Restriction endonuclease subunit S n=1 Tax=Microcystis wesenbergii NRERC-220 TaxID=3068991 RepID=A0ABU3HID3_9CHRO|nr:restriction endonuclease subunit S [Microcystis wesenbergii]MDT3674307.1 restriction endonuclease subunit S [Microcystis wesenbergii NRERC-220]